MLSQQSSGCERETKKIFVNCENTFGEFNFERGGAATEVLSPAVMIGRLSPFDASSSDIYMNLMFSSKLDGKLTTAEMRPSLDVVFVLDISGSMGCRFPDDVDGRDKLEVAKDCLLEVIKSLGYHDRVAIITFNTSNKLVHDLSPITPLTLKQIKKKIKAISTCGGTDLAQGLEAGFSLLQAHQNGERENMQRVFFMTDMESSTEDENTVLDMSRKAAQTAQAQNNMTTAHNMTMTVRSMTAATATKRSSKKSAPLVTKASITAKKRASSSPNGNDKQQNTISNKPIHVSIIGIGVDLSVNTVETLSTISGAKYYSVISAGEFMNNVAKDFHYDVTPIGYDIELSLSQGISFTKIYGSAELNSLPPQSTTAIISSEFPVPLDSFGHTSGGVYLCKLEVESYIAPNPSLTVSWTDRQGIRQRVVRQLVLPDGPSPELPPTPLSLPTPLSEAQPEPASHKRRAAASASSSSSSGSGNGSALSVDVADANLRKAVALMSYVRTLTTYVCEENEEDDKSAKADQDDDDDEDNDHSGFGFGFGSQRFGSQPAFGTQFGSQPARRMDGSIMWGGGFTAPRPMRPMPVSVLSVSKQDTVSLDTFKTLTTLGAYGIIEVCSVSVGASSSSIPSSPPSPTVSGSPEGLSEGHIQSEGHIGIGSWLAGIWDATFLSLTSSASNLSSNNNNSSSSSSADGIPSMTMGSTLTLPSDTPKRLISHAMHAHRFQRLRVYLLEQLAMCGDDSLVGNGSNQNILQTIDQIIELETADVQKLLDTGLTYVLPTSHGVPVPSSFSSSSSSSSSSDTSTEDHIPRGFLCPITLALMKLPVIAADGNSYERTAIEKWFRDGKLTSPITNLLMSHQELIPNRALLSSIDEFIASPSARAAAAAAAAGTDVDTLPKATQRTAKRQKR